MGGAWTISTATTAGANTERMRIDNAGTALFNGDVHVANGKGVVIGNTAQVTVGGAVSELQVVGTSWEDSQMMLGCWNTTNGIHAQFNFLKSGNASIDGDTAVAADEALGAINFYANDGVDNASYAAAIQAHIDAGVTVAENDVAGRLTFHTTSDGSASPTERMRIDSGGHIYMDGNVFVNESVSVSNAKQTRGLTINQGGYDNEILAFKSSDVAHGITDYAETNTFCAITKHSGALGGVNIAGFNETTRAVAIRGYASTDDATHTASGTAYVEVWGAKKSGTALGATGANANIFTVGDEGVGVHFIVDGEGDLFADGSAATVYDTVDDVAVLSAFDRNLSKEGAKGYIEQEWEKTLAENEQTLIDLNILGGPRVGVQAEERGLINYTGLARLHNSAIRQVYTQLIETVGRLELAESKLKMLEA